MKSQITFLNLVPVPVMSHYIIIYMWQIFPTSDYDDCNCDDDDNCNDDEHYR